jgi:hypothetical protein
MAQTDPNPVSGTPWWAPPGPKPVQDGYATPLQAPGGVESPPRPRQGPVGPPNGAEKRTYARPNGGVTGGRNWVQSGSEMTFPKSGQGPSGGSKTMKATRFEAFWRFWPPRMDPKCPENAPLWDQKGVKKWQKVTFPKSHPGPAGGPLGTIWGHIEAFLGF